MRCLIVVARVCSGDQVPDRTDSPATCAWRRRIGYTNEGEKMTHEEIEQKLTYLLDRQEIADVITTYCRAVDRLDREALDRAYHEAAALRG